MTEARTFRLYPEERHWFSFTDYGAVLDAVIARQAKRILEFGPGSSTLALIEGGATHIDACEDSPDWFGVYQERLAARFPDIVTLHPYEWADPLIVDSIGRARYDLALIDGPLGTLNRPAVLTFCLARCEAVLMPTEDAHGGVPVLRPHIERIAKKYRRQVEWRETGPLSGGFALITKPERSKA